MRGRWLGPIIVASALFPSSAGAAPVIVLSASGRATIRDDRFLTIPPTTPGPAATSRAGAAGIADVIRPARQVTVASTLADLRHAGEIPAAAYGNYRGLLAAAVAAAQRLHGTRATELGAILENLHAIAALGLLTPSRLPALFQTLDRNLRWWTSGPLLSSGQQVEFAGSQLVWQYYPGQGIELQVLGSFGKADGFYTAGPAHYRQLRQILAELIPLAALRDGRLVWEYYFAFDGGGPPWTSAMSQGTAIEALTRGFKAFGDRSYLNLARRALSIFMVAPPRGVAERTPGGERYLMYSFAPGVHIINGFLQSLIGLYDYAQASGSRLAAQLFAAGDAQARTEVPRYDTGAWSLYQPGQEDTLDYHTLVTGFLEQLCSRTRAHVYCETAIRFERDLKTPPSLALLTSRAPARRPIALRFALSKYSHVGIVLVRNGATMLLTSGYFPYGEDAFAVPALAPGRYTVRLAATDLVGNFARIIRTIVIS